MAHAGDPLAEVLALLRPETVLAAELLAHGRWGLDFDAYPHIKFGTVVAGDCVIKVRGEPAQTFSRGDVYLLGNPPPYSMASDLATRRQSANAVFSRAEQGVVKLGRRSGSFTHLVGGHFIFDAMNAHLLLDALPRLVRIPAGSAGPARDIARLLVDEIRSSQLGRERALDQLAQLLLTFTLRALEVEPGAPSRAGWLRALADPRVGAALRHLHANVETRASLVELARVAGMSRTPFAARFKALVGMPPLAYAIQWRMSLAKDALRSGDRSVGELAFALGYGSESAFSTAFRRVVGRSPRAYRELQRRR